MRNAHARGANVSKIRLPVSRDGYVVFTEDSKYLLGQPRVYSTYLPFTIDSQRHKVILSVPQVFGQKYNSYFNFTSNLTTSRTAGKTVMNVDKRNNSNECVVCR